MVGLARPRAREQNMNQFGVESDWGHLFSSCLCLHLESRCVKQVMMNVKDESDYFIMILPGILLD